MFSCHENVSVICSKAQGSWNKLTINIFIIPTTTLNHPDVNIQHVEHSREKFREQKAFNLL